MQATGHSRGTHRCFTELYPRIAKCQLESRNRATGDHFIDGLFDFHSSDLFSNPPVLQNHANVSQLNFEIKPKGQKYEDGFKELPFFGELESQFQKILEETMKEKEPSKTVGLEMKRIDSEMIKI